MFQFKMLEGRNLWRISTATYLQEGPSKSGRQQEELRREVQLVSDLLGVDVDGAGRRRRGGGVVVAAPSNNEGRALEAGEDAADRLHASLENPRDLVKKKKISGKFRTLMSNITSTNLNFLVNQ